MAGSELAKTPTVLESRMTVIESGRDRITTFLQPLGLNVDRFFNQVRLALRQNPDLQECDVTSLVDAVVKAAELGLDPTGNLGGAWIVPFKKQGKPHAQLIPGYRGLIDLAVRSGAVVGLDAVIVHAKDVFDYQKGSHPKLIHIPRESAVKIARWEEQGDKVIAFDAANQEIDLDPGQMVAAYARAEFPGGGHQFYVMGLRDLIANRNRSASWRNPRSAWHDKDVQVQEMMFRKAPVLRLCKLLSLSPERHSLMVEAVRLAEQDVEIAEEERPAAAPRRTSKARTVVESPPPASGSTVDGTVTTSGAGQQPTGEPEPGSDG